MIRHYIYRKVKEISLVLKQLQPVDKINSIRDLTTCYTYQKF